MNGEFRFKKRQIFYLGVKRFLDILLSFILLLIAALPMLVVAIITRIAMKGPALFKQTRLGKNEKPFTLVKFRSMRMDAPQVPPDQLDTRTYITKWGRFIRATSIDELPQLWLIFIGKMSFIGPRPCQDKEHEGDLVVERETTDPSAFVVRPGLSGLAQVRMHRDHDPKQKAELDSEYVRRISLWMDCRCFVGTFKVIFHISNKKKEKKQ